MTSGESRGYSGAEGGVGIVRKRGVRELGNGGGDRYFGDSKRG